MNNRIKVIVSEIQATIVGLTCIKRQIILVLPEQSYGEYIIYDKLTPVYYLNIFDENPISKEILYAIDFEKKDIDNIIEQILLKHKKSELSLFPNYGKYCFVHLSYSIENIKEIELDVFPFSMKH